MNDQDYIRKGVELADGFEIKNPTKLEIECWGEQDILWVEDYGSCPINLIPQLVFDALAAQLVRQVDATGSHWVRPLPDSTTIFHSHSNDAVQAVCGLGRTMNAIKVIVDSKVLEAA